MYKIVLAFIPRKVSTSLSHRPRPNYLRLRTGIKAGPKCNSGCKAIMSQQS